MCGGRDPPRSQNSGNIEQQNVGEPPLAQQLRAHVARTFGAVDVSGHRGLPLRRRHLDRSTTRDYTGRIGGISGLALMCSRGMTCEGDRSAPELIALDISPRRTQRFMLRIFTYASVVAAAVAALGVAPQQPPVFRGTGE